MKSILGILVHTPRALDYLDNQEAILLHIKSVFLFFFYGLIVYYLTQDYNNMLISPFMDLLFVISICVFLGTIYSLVLHKINIWLRGSGSYADISAVISHATIPMIIVFNIIFFAKNVFFKDAYFNYAILFYVGWLFSVKILVQGFLKYNHKKGINALINLSPLVLIYGGLLVLRIYYSW